MSGPNRWGVVVAYAAVGAATQVLWLTFAPITTDTAAHYGVSESAVGWLAEVFPLLYVVLAIPAGPAFALLALAALAGLPFARRLSSLGDVREAPA